MAYESPIQVFIQNVNCDIDETISNGIVNVIANYGIHVEQEELIKALKYDREQYQKGFADGLNGAVKHGHWLETDAYPHHVYCSVCYKTYLNNREWIKNGYVEPAEYCPHCGAKMDEPVSISDTLEE